MFAKGKICLHLHSMFSDLIKLFLGYIKKYEKTKENFDNFVAKEFYWQNDVFTFYSNSSKYKNMTFNLVN